MLAGDLDSLRSLLADDVVVMPENAPAVLGREAAETFYEALHESIDITAWSIPADDIEVQGNRALVRGPSSECVQCAGLRPAHTAHTGWICQ
jgi:ketosteroid isomerase-like protein